MVLAVGRIALCKIQMLRDKCSSADYPVENEEDEMKRKAISILVAGLVMASLAGCGTQAETANSVVSGQSSNETVVVDSAAANEADKNADPVDEGATLDDNGYIVFYEDQQGVSEDVDLNNLVILEPAVELHFNADTDVYDAEGYLIGYAKAGVYISFHNYNEKWSGFELDGVEMLMKMEDLQKNAVNEAVAGAVSENTSGLEEDITDGNIVLYGGEKYPQKYSSLDEGIPEEANIVLTNVEADIPLYSGDGRLCGHLNKGGNIVVTEHCTVATAWYRFENPIEGTEYDYLYLLRYEMVMSNDEKENIEEILREEDYSERIVFLDAPDADMDCYEFSIARDDYFDIGLFLINGEFLQRDEFNNLKYLTFYVECTRNRDYFDCKVYYK